MSSFGRIFRVNTFGESHSQYVGCTVEGFPANEFVDQKYIQACLDRRKPGQSSLTTPRKEDDLVQVISGLNTQSVSLGSPITMIVGNMNIKPNDYSQFDNVPRPGHADYTYQMKYHTRAESGGGRSSARETVGRVCAGALAQQLLQKKGIKICAWVSSIGDVEIPSEIQKKLINNPPSQQQIDQLGTFKQMKSQDIVFHLNQVTNQFACNYNKIQEQIPNVIYQEEVNVRCPHPETGIKMLDVIHKVQNEKDSIGGTITCCITGVPAGLGEPCFDKLPALLAHAMISIPATKGFEIGSGFEGTKMKGSQHNDKFIKNQNENKLLQSSNNAGGTLGGISNGEIIYFRVAFKPVSTIGIDQQTVDFNGNPVLLQAKGRHDPCILPRAPPIVEAMSALVILDLLLINNSQQ